MTGRAAARRQAIAIRDDAIAAILADWNAFRETMESAGNPGLRPLYDGRETQAWQGVPRHRREVARKLMGWTLHESEYVLPVLLTPDGRVGSLHLESLKNHLLTDSQAWLVIDSMGYGHDMDAVEMGDVEAARDGAKVFVGHWRKLLAEVADRVGVAL